MSSRWSGRRLARSGRAFDVKQCVVRFLARLAVMQRISENGLA